MTAAMKRDRLITFLSGADEKKVKALYSLLEDEINESDVAAGFTEQQLDIIEERRAALLSGKDKGIDWQTMHDNIRKKKKIA
jgi:hypothetical protein